MTDLTDQDRRAARSWAKNWQGDQDDDTSAAARVILATVDAPAPTLAEELREFGETPATERDMGTFGDIADRVEQVEQERDQAKKIAELNLNTAAEMKIQRDNLRAEVERLTAERVTEPSLTLNDWSMTATVARKEKVAPDQQANTQETLSGSLPDPADVKPGEAWLVQVDGKAVAALRIGNGRWVTASGTGFYVWTHGVERLVSSLLPETDLIDRAATNAAETITNAFGVPEPRQITTREILDEAPRRTVIRDKDGVVCERASLGDGWYSPESTTDQTDYIKYPATVLWAPEA